MRYLYCLLVRHVGAGQVGLAQPQWGAWAHRVQLGVGHVGHRGGEGGAGGEGGGAALLYITERLDGPIRQSGDYFTISRIFF